MEGIRDLYDADGKLKPLGEQEIYIQQPKSPSTAIAAVLFGEGRLEEKVEKLKSMGEVVEVIG